MAPWKKHLKKLAPGQVLILVYATAIFAGTAALCLPLAAKGEPLSLLDALFTATSAQCVTGLIVVDTGTKLTLFGQTVVLVLIQLGGLGITTFSVYLFFYLRIGVGVRGRWMVQETLLHTPVSSLRDLVREILMLTFIVEGAGTLLMVGVFVPEMGFWQGLYYSFFHSVSAFCNAGFSLFSDSLIGYRAHPLINVTVMGLIILGGIGFLVIRELLNFLPGRKMEKRRRLSLHSRLALLTSGLLISGGALLIGFLEYQGALAGMGFGEGVLTALFQSVTARTAGFNTIDLIQFTPPTLFIIIFLMFIGASPGSAGGGIKTTSFALFMAILHSRLKGNSHNNIFHRTVPNKVVTKALALAMLATLLIAAAIFGLMAVQHPGPATPDNLAAFMVYTFEAVSAFATVGLSIGGTAQLVPLGKVIIILLMFIGRVGLLTVAFSIARRSRGADVEYAQENIMVG